MLVINCAVLRWKESFVTPKAEESLLESFLRAEWQQLCLTPQSQRAHIPSLCFCRIAWTTCRSWIRAGILLCLYRSYGLPEVVQQYKTLKVPADCTFHIQTPPFKNSLFPNRFPIPFHLGRVETQLFAESQLHTMLSVPAQAQHRPLYKIFIMLLRYVCG